MIPDTTGLVQVLEEYLVRELNALATRRYFQNFSVAGFVLKA